MQAAHPGDHVEIPAAVHTADSSALTEEELTSVTWLQTSLNRLGDHLTVDDEIGNATKDAVGSFQAAHGLHEDEIAGPVTRAAIKAELIKLEGGTK